MNLSGPSVCAIWGADVALGLATAGVRRVPREAAAYDGLRPETLAARS